MKYYKTPRYKKAIKKSCDSLSSFRTVKKIVKNPVKTLINTLIDKGSNINTKRKQKGYYKNRKQILNPKTKRWVVIDTKLNKSLRQGRRKGIPYNNIRKG